MYYVPLNDLDYGDDELENLSLELDKDPVLAFLRKRIRENSEEISLQNQVEKLVNILDQYDLQHPEFNLNVEQLDVALYSSELLQNLKLQVNTKGTIGRKTVQFRTDLVTRERDLQKFKKSIIQGRGYLEHPSDYFEVSQSKLSEGTSVTTLRNSRVILFWRGFDLGDETVKRILSLGLVFLVKGLTEAELLFEIREVLPDGVFDVKIRSKEDAYVLIGVELPVLNF